MSDLSSCHWCLEREKDLWLLREIDGNQDEIRTCCSARFLDFLREPESERNQLIPRVNSKRFFPFPLNFPLKKSERNI